MAVEMVNEREIRLADETALQMYLTVDGRINRLRYFLRGLALGLAGMVFYFALYFAVSEVAASILYCLVMMAQIPLCIRRSHDMGKSGWWNLLLLVPLVNAVWSLFLLFKKGTEGDNAFGPDPLAE